MKTTILCGILIAVVLLSGCTESTTTTGGSDALLPTPAELGSGFAYLYDVGPKTENMTHGNCPMDHTAVYEKGAERYSITVRECKDEASARQFLQTYIEIGSWTDAHFSIGDEAYEKANSGGITVVYAKGTYASVVSSGINDDLFESIARTAESKL